MGTPEKQAGVALHVSVQLVSQVCWKAYTGVRELVKGRSPVLNPTPNPGLQATASSLRSCVAAASSGA
jgi:hypothetical protein